MRELLPDLEQWLAKGEPVALATVISTWGSAPRPAGSVMAMSQSGGIVGSVSGGCVESAVVNSAKEVLKTGKAERLHFSVSDDTAWGVGLACGGEIDIFVQPVDTKVFNHLLPRLKADEPMVLSTVVDGKEIGAQTLSDESGGILTGVKRATSPGGKVPELIRDKGEQIFANPLPPSPTLIMIGGVHIAVALAKLAHTLDFRTVIIDPRKAFATTERFADADELIQTWPEDAFKQHPLNSATAVASLSHDPKIDDPALKAALRSTAFYVGALGSKGTQAKRKARLLEAGFSEEDLGKLHAPIGLEINAETPEEIALAIMAQVIEAYRAA